jgi:hypothetical protein
MRALVIILCLTGTLALVAMRYDTRGKQKNICESLKPVRQLTKLQFDPADHEKINGKQLRRVDSASYESIFPYEHDNEETYYYGKFRISDNRLGVVCFNKTHECDHEVYSFTLHIVDNCSTAKEFIHLSFADGHDPQGGEITSSLNKTMDTLTLKETKTSEWVMGDPSMQDTLFTTIYKLDLKSKNLDTVWKKTTYKILKQENP